MEDSDCRHGSDAISAELGKLITRTTVDIHEAVHVADAEALNVRLGVLLPLGTETRQL